MPSPSSSSGRDDPQSTERPLKRAKLSKDSELALKPGFAWAPKPTPVHLWSLDPLFHCHVKIPISAMHDVLKAPRGDPNIQDTVNLHIFEQRRDDEPVANTVRGDQGLLLSRQDCWEYLHGRVIRHFEVVGIAVGVSHKMRLSSILVDDGTGTIECVRYINHSTLQKDAIRLRQNFEERANHVADIQLGMLVRARGILRDHPEYGRQIVCERGNLCRASVTEDYIGPKAPILLRELHQRVRVRAMKGSTDQIRNRRIESAVLSKKMRQEPDDGGWSAEVCHWQSMARHHQMMYNQRLQIPEETLRHWRLYCRAAAMSEDEISLLVNHISDLPSKPRDQGRSIMTYKEQERLQRAEEDVASKPLSLAQVLASAIKTAMDVEEEKHAFTIDEISQMEVVVAVLCEIQRRCPEDCATFNVAESPQEIIMAGLCLLEEAGTVLSEPDRGLWHFAAKSRKLLDDLLAVLIRSFKSSFHSGNVSFRTNVPPGTYVGPKQMSRSGFAVLPETLLWNTLDKSGGHLTKLTSESLDALFEELETHGVIIRVRSTSGVDYFISADKVPIRM